MYISYKDGDVTDVSLHNDEYLPIMQPEYTEGPPPAEGPGETQQTTQKPDILYKAPAEADYTKP